MKTRHLFLLLPTVTILGACVVDPPRRVVVEHHNPPPHYASPYFIGDGVDMRAPVYVAAYPGQTFYHRYDPGCDCVRIVRLVEAGSSRYWLDHTGRRVHEGHWEPGRPSPRAVSSYRDWSHQHQAEFHHTPPPQWNTPHRPPAAAPQPTPAIVAPPPSGAKPSPVAPQSPQAAAVSERDKFRQIERERRAEKSREQMRDGAAKVADERAKLSEERAKRYAARVAEEKARREAAKAAEDKAKSERASKATPDRIRPAPATGDKPAPKTGDKPSGEREHDRHHPDRPEGAPR